MEEAEHGPPSVVEGPVAAKERRVQEKAAPGLAHEGRVDEARRIVRQRISATTSFTRGGGGAMLHGEAEGLVISVC
jgi:hypothetical protein